jgi:hypothetical protein
MRYLKVHAIPMALVILFLVAVVGCGGGKSGDNRTTQERTGSVNLSELGGQGLAVTTAYTASAPVNEQGNFTITVSAVKAQLVAVMDSNDQARGVATSLPTEGGRLGEPIRIDAESTALTMVFATPGILSTLPDEARNRIREIRALSSFPGLVAKVRERLRSMPIPQLAQEPEVESAMEECIEEWYSTYGRGRIEAQGHINPGPPSAKFEARVLNESNEREVAIELLNGAWRFVRVQRRDLRGGVELRVSQLGNMGGARPGSWASLFSLSLGDPTKRNDHVDFSATTGADTVEYWISGPGLNLRANVNPPPSIDVRWHDALGTTVIYYLLFPLLDFIAGIPSLIPSPARLMEIAGSVWIYIRDNLEVRAAIEALSQARNRWEWTREGIRALTAMTTAAIPVLKSLGILTAPKAVFVAKILAAGVLAFSVANLTVAAIGTLLVPSVTKVEVRRGPTTTGSFTCTLRWDTLGDVDLHVWSANGEHCYYANMNVTHGWLDFDNVTGYGPENITFQNAPPGRYRVAVNFYRRTGTASPNANVVVTSGTLRVDRGRYQLTVPNFNTGYPITGNTPSWWRPCDIVITPNGQVQVVDPDYAPLHRGRAEPDPPKKRAGQ